ncbi:MAG: hypothetical protein JXA10_15240, partial [Anaerolineae bacterium]|nr:hypothetical protein [Anaerolineae bacterium]
MNWPMILRRNRYYKAHLVSIFLSMCVVLILPVLYETYTANAAERYVRQTLADQPLRNQFIMLWNDTPPPDVDADADHAQLGELLVQTRRFSLANGIQCGLTYETGAVITGLSEASLNCYTILAYPDQDIDTYFTLVAGRMPVHLQRPQQAAGYMGAPDAEAVITQTAAERSKLTVGQRIVYNEEVTQARIIEIVGIVRLNDPDLPFWRSQTILTNGVYTPV